MGLFQYPRQPAVSGEAQGLVPARRWGSIAAEGAMAEADSGDHTATKAGDKLPRAHKRCVNKDCGEVLSLATKVSPAGN